MTDEQYTMKMVGHHLQRNNADFRVITGDGIPLLAYSASKLRKHHPWCVGTTGGRVTTPCYHTKQRATPFCHHRNHIHLAQGIVVSYTPALHGGLFLASKCLLPFVLFSVHIMQRYSDYCRLPNILTEKKTAEPMPSRDLPPEIMHSFRFLCKAMENNGSRFDGYDFYCLTLQPFRLLSREQDNDCLTQT